MKSVLSDKCCKKEEKPFPKLMISSYDGGIVLFRIEREGFYVHVSESDCNYGLGDGSVGFNMNLFTDYEGDVCLTND